MQEIGCLTVYLIFGVFAIFLIKFKIFRGGRQFIPTSFPRWTGGDMAEKDTRWRLRIIKIFFGRFLNNRE